MICPYRNKIEVTIESWMQNPTESEAQLTNGQTATTRIRKPADCEREMCGAWYNGKCNYNMTQQQ